MKKKFLSLMFAVVAVFGISTSAFAEDIAVKDVAVNDSLCWICWYS